MKKLEKLKLNEMQDYSVIGQNEQMMLKGGGWKDWIDDLAEALFGSGEVTVEGSADAETSGQLKYTNDSTGWSITFDYEVHVEAEATVTIEGEEYCENECE